MKKSALNMLGVSSPIKQDVKFDTTAHDYGKRAAKITPKERSEYRKGLGHALSFVPIGGAIGGAAKILGKSFGKIKNVLKGIDDKISTFANAPKQYKNIGRPYASTITKPAKDLAVAPKVSKPTITNTFSDRQHAYLQQQMKQREVGSASWRLQRTHQKAVSDFYAGKGPKKPPHKYKDGKSFWTSFFPGGY